MSEAEQVIAEDISSIVRSLTALTEAVDRQGIVLATAILELDGHLRIRGSGLSNAVREAVKIFAEDTAGRLGR